MVGDAQAGLKELGAALHGWQAPEAWLGDARRAYGEWNGFVDQRSGPTNAELPTPQPGPGVIIGFPVPATGADGRPGERGAGGVLTHSLSLMVQYISSVGPVIRLFDQNFVAGTITVLDDIPLVVPLGADQIGFELSNEDTKSTSFEGSYAFVSNGVSGPGVTFAVAGPMFTMADTVRATVQVYSAVPEPSAWALGSIALGMGLVSLSTGFSIMLLAIVPWGLGVFASNSSQQARLVALAPMLAPASIALNTSAMYAGQAIGAGSGGALIHRLGLGALPVAGCAILVCALGLSLWAAERAKRHPVRNPT